MRSDPYKATEALFQVHRRLVGKAHLWGSHEGAIADICEAVLGQRCKGRKRGRTVVQELIEPPRDTRLGEGEILTHSPPLRPMPQTAGRRRIRGGL